MHSVSSLRTMVAKEASGLADVVNFAFLRLRFGKGAFQLVLTEPYGPSTHGGAHAKQKLCLVRYGESIVIGEVSPVTSRATVRSFTTVVERYFARYKQNLDLAHADWDDILWRLETALGLENVAVLRERTEAISSIPPRHAKPAKSTPREVRVPTIAVFATIGVVAAALLALMPPLAKTMSDHATSTAHEIVTR